jgi:hypothetical protein
MSQSEPELKVIEPEKMEKVTSVSVNEIHYLKPKRERSKKQIQWSCELGKRSKELKLKKKEKNHEITTVEEAPEVRETPISLVPEVKEVNNKYPTKLVFHDYLYPYLGIGFLIICGGGVYYFYKLKKNVKPPVEQIKYTNKF